MLGSQLPGAPPSGDTNTIMITTPPVTGTGTVITTPPLPDCSWFQAPSGGKCEFSFTGTLHTVFQLPGSVVVGLINTPKPGEVAVLTEGMMTLSTAISLVVWGGAAYLLWTRFSK